MKRCYRSFGRRNFLAAGLTLQPAMGDIILSKQNLEYVFSCDFLLVEAKKN